MSDPFFRRLIRSMMSHCADGRPLIEIDQSQAAAGPCPHCLWEIIPSDLGFISERPGKGALEHYGIVVCNGCKKPVIFREPGKYEVMPRKLARQLPKATRNFIERSQKLITEIDDVVRRNTN